jgi:hypothetical protein
MANVIRQPITEHAWNNTTEVFDPTVTWFNLPVCEISQLKLVIAMYMAKARVIEVSDHWEEGLSLNIETTLFEIRGVLDFSSNELRCIGEFNFQEEHVSVAIGNLAAGMSILLLESQGCFWYANIRNVIATSAKRFDYIAIAESGSVVYVESKGSQQQDAAYAASDKGLREQVIPWLKDSAKAGLSNQGWSFGTHFPVDQPVRVYAQHAVNHDFSVLPRSEHLRKNLIQHYLRWLGLAGLGVHARSIAAASSEILGFMDARDFFSGLPPVRKVTSGGGSYIFPLLASNRSGFASGGLRVNEIPWTKSRMPFAGQQNIFFGIEESIFIKVLHAAVGFFRGPKMFVNRDEVGIECAGIEQVLLPDGCIVLRANEIECMQEMEAEVLTAFDQREMIYQGW